jgi:hypothetical protein
VECRSRLQKELTGLTPVIVVCVVAVENGYLISSKPKATLYRELPSVLAIKILIRASDWPFALRFYVDNSSKEAD